MTKDNSSNVSLEIATFGIGCFWCGDAVFRRLPGVRTVISGYMGGHTQNPTYEEICSGTTGHAEVVQVHFDANETSFSTLLDLFWQMHDPTTLNRQGADVGTQYRSAIFYHNETQQNIAIAAKQAQEASGTFANPIVTEITQASEFTEAEGYHQGYYDRNKNAGYCRVVISPKLTKLGIEA